MFHLQILDGNGNTNAAIPIFQKAAMLDPESKAVQQVNKIHLKFQKISKFKFICFRNYQN